MDDRGDAAGLPLTSVLVLRNLARNLGKVGGGVDGKGDTGENEGWMERLFGGVRGSLWFVMAHNRPLAGYVADLMGVVDRGWGV